MHRFTGALVAAIVVAACVGDPAGTLFRTRVQGPDGSYPQEVVLGDRTGLVTGIDPADSGGQGASDVPTLTTDEDDAKTLILSWGNGACERPAISFFRSGDRFDLRVEPRPIIGSCMAILLLRAIRIHLAEPISLDRIDICCPP